MPAASPRTPVCEQFFSTLQAGITSELWQDAVFAIVGYTCITRFCEKVGRKIDLTAHNAPSPSRSDLVRTFGKIGLMSFGGPAGQIGLMQRILVDDKKWIDEARFLHALNFCMLLPGPEAMQLATYIGWALQGTVGGLIAGLLFILPGAVVVTTISALYAHFAGTAWLPAMFFGIKAVVLAIVLEALLRVSKRALKSGLAYGIAAAAFVAIYAFGVPFPLIILAAGLLGAAAGPKVEAQAPATAGPALAQSVRTALVWIGVWLAPLGVVMLVFGARSAFTQIGLFFSKMAVVTFGGAYAVLAYVAQEAVVTYQWLTPADMLNGLGMAETTPGPLILVLTYIGYLAGSRASGPMMGLPGGLLGAALTTWVTFAPCFLWIFVGGPYVERLRHLSWLNNALKAITAAVVGVILNLTVWFGLHVIFAKVDVVSLGLMRLVVPELISVDLLALSLSLCAAFLLVRVHFGLLKLIGLAALAGLGLKLVIFPG